MNAVFITDVHGRGAILRRLPPADVLIVGGDITHFGNGADAVALLTPVAERYERVLALPGNCDAPDVAGALDERGWGLHLTPVLVQGVLFFGVGGSNPTPAFTPNEWRDAEMLVKAGPAAEYAAREPAQLRILVAHAPPLNSGADRLSFGRSAGSRAVADLAQAFDAHCVLCGHIHEARGVFHWDGRRVVNPGPLRDGWFCRIETSGDGLKVALDRVGSRGPRSHFPA